MKQKNISLSALIVCLVVLATYVKGSDPVTLIVFSKDRPMQLYAFLESAYRHMSGNYQPHVIYYTSHNEYEKGYSIVKNRFKNIPFIKQLSRTDFKKLTLDSIYKNPGKYVIFAVDDIIIKDTFNISECVALLEKHHADSFHLRLGSNIDFNYIRNMREIVPSFKQVASNIYVWNFANIHGVFNYAYTLDMAIYRKSDIKATLHALKFDSPNHFEAEWNKRGLKKGKGLCFKISKVLNVPLNIVQTDWVLRSMKSYSPEDLLKKFNQGLKIDIINPWFKLHNRSPHVGNYQPQFIKR